MIDTVENIKETIKQWEKISKELGITEEEINSSEYDYMDEE